MIGLAIGCELIDLCFDFLIHWDTPLKIGDRTISAREAGERWWLLHMRCFVCWLFTWSQWAMQLHTWDFYNHCLSEVGFLYYNNILKGKHVNFAIAACLHWLGGHHGFPAIHCMWMHKKRTSGKFMQIYGPLIFHLTPFGSLKSLKLYLEILPASHGKAPSVGRTVLRKSFCWHLNSVRWWALRGDNPTTMTVRIIIVTVVTVE